MANVDKAQEVETGGPRAPVVESIRVDKVGRGARTLRAARTTLAVVVVVILLVPVVWMVMTAFKSQPDAIAVPPKVIFKPRPLDSFVFLFTDRFLLPRGKLAQYPEGRAQAPRGDPSRRASSCSAIRTRWATRREPTRC